MCVLFKCMHMYLITHGQDIIKRKAQQVRMSVEIYLTYDIVVNFLADIFIICLTKYTLSP